MVLWCHIHKWHVKWHEEYEFSKEQFEIFMIFLYGLYNYKIEHQIP